MYLVQIRRGSLYSQNSTAAATVVGIFYLDLLVEGPTEPTTELS